ncbi:bumetanide-sensitive sodium-(potassium)-chloride cotransporter isoform X2 [Hyposmocoma kahamanoa]|uniref:bumetanide-sensitive sodium-(potassium)-chloride cotransporter isoform X2 n=1 Tax=Hyposmocoma kahamanoa TaxID=1477025 RepID=UPI000E6D9DD8|nr:bumetanide-sensitive sodium-(potassium)-chloride cotransporter isoform X2 [Hyposmocoma kahamanoa]
MSSPEKDIELSPVKTDPNPIKTPAGGTDKLKVAVDDEEDVIIGRFRKISSAKSMAATNGNIQYPTDLPPRSDDVEAGLQMRKDPGERDKLLENNVEVKNQVTKSSFRDMEKPSRFKDQPSTTRFQMEAKPEDYVTEESEDGMDSDDPLTATDTKYGKSFRHFTREALPRLDNYRNVLSLHAAPRPTLDELHNASLSRKPGQTIEKDLAPSGMITTNIKFGWVKGVLMRCLLNIWGVMLFLRLSWVVGQAGIAESLLLILTTSVVTTITALSMSAISTNGVIKGGGTYYMISRSLGPEFGGSIGLIFSMANAVACAMYVVGFGESLITLIPANAYMVNKEWDQAIYGCITIVLLTGIVIVGMEWEAKAQIVLLIILLAAIADFCIGSVIGPKSDIELAQGFVGYNMSVLQENLWSDYRPYEGTQSHNFFSVFSIFFPAATGILAGANISGDLKDPQKSIPKGTLLAIVLTTISYLIIAVIAGWTVLRDASGEVLDVANWTMSNCGHDCRYGLHHSNDVIRLVSGFGPLIYGGCFAATLSSALASLVSAPKVFQALCQDKLYPYLEFFAKGYGPNNEPVRGYVLTFIIAVAFILMGGLNQIAPLISNFFLAAYALINFSTFHASLAKPVGWRPTFRFYNMWLSLLGAMVCVAIMFVISWITALVTIGCLLALYLLVSYRKPDVNWGSTTQAQTYKTALSGVHHLNRITEHVKNYRPQILVLTGFPAERPILTDFSYLLTKGLSLMLCGHVVQGPVNHRAREALTNRAYHWFNKRKMKSFYSIVDDVGFKDGASALIQASGLGKLKPNILMMGFKEDWLTCDRSEVVDYVEVLHKALDVHMALAILRVEGGQYSSDALDDDLRAYLHDVTDKNLSLFSHSMGDNKESKSTESLNTHSVGSSLSDVSLDTPQLRRAGVSADPGAAGPLAPPATAATDRDHAPKPKEKDKERGLGSAVRRAFGASVARRASSFTSVEQFTKRQAGSVDVWWLYDDGGLTLLLPYILSTRRAWSSCPLRVFTLANKNTELELEERNMASLLSKFRIDYSALKMVADITKRPRDSTLTYFDKLIAPFRTHDDSNDATGITDADLIAARDRTYRHLRLRELISEHSSNARLVCVTLPMPRRRAVVPPPLYHAWLHAIATAADRVLLVRGNHAAVLTFYS